MSITHLKSPEAAARWLQSWVTGTLRTDSRLVQPGDGMHVDAKALAQQIITAQQGEIDQMQKMLAGNP